MLDGLERDTEIVTGRSKAELVADALTGTNFDRVAYATETSDVTEASNAAGDNSLIIINGEVTGAQTLQGNQTLQGGGPTIDVRGRRSGLVVPFTAPGATGRLTGPGNGDDHLTLEGSNTHVSGLTITGPGSGGGNGVEVGDDKSNLFLTNLQINNAGSDGIYIGDRNEVVIDGGSIDSSFRDGIEMNDNNVRIVIRNLTITNPNNAGIEIGDGNEFVMIDGITIRNARIRGIGIEDDNLNVSIANTVIDGVGRSGIAMDANNSVVVNNTTISNTGEDGINFEDPGNTVRVTNSTFDNIGSNNTNNDVFHFDYATTILLRNNTFVGDIGGNIFNFEDEVSLVLDGSTGNSAVGVTFTGGGQVCEELGTGSFTGTIEVDGIVYSSPC